MSARYPNCERLGLRVQQGHRESPESPGYTGYVLASDLEKLLSAAPVVYDGHAGMSVFAGGETWGPVKFDERDHTCISSNFVSSKRQALLVGVQPIVRDTAESLLREMVEKFKSGATDTILSSANRRWLDRARALLSHRNENEAGEE